MHPAADRVKVRHCWGINIENNITLLFFIRFIEFSINKIHKHKHVGFGTLTVCPHLLNIMSCYAAFTRTFVDDLMYSDLYQILLKVDSWASDTVQTCKRIE